MSEFLNIVVISLGLVSGIFFCIGTVASGHKQILEISSTYWNFNKHLASSLSEQKAQYSVGASLLVLSFAAQAIGVLFPAIASAPVPALLPRGAVLLPLSIFLLWGVSHFVSRLLFHRLKDKVLAEYSRREAEYLAQEAAKKS